MRPLTLCILIFAAAGCSSPSSEPDLTDGGGKPDAASGNDAGRTDGGGMADVSDPPDADSPDIGADAETPTQCGDGRCNGSETPDSCAADCGPCQATTGFTAFEQSLVNLEADTWFEAPDTMMRDVCVDDSVGVRGVGGCSQIVQAWSGGTYDSINQRMLVWGGGHNDYHGNEVYAFSLVDGTWARLTEPMATDHLDRDPIGPNADQPVSRHTYEGVEFVSHLNAMFGHGGSRAADGSGTNLTWLLDLDALTWTNTDPAVAGPGQFTLSSAYDAVGQRMFVRATREFYVYSFGDNTWSVVQDFGTGVWWPRYERSGDKTAEIDTSRSLFWSVGSGDILVWNIETNTVATEDWVTTGAGDYTNADWVDSPDQLFESGGAAVYDAPAPGLAYDLVDDAMVAWANEGGPWVLDLQTRVWTRGSGVGAPTSNNSGGTFGRWRYAPRYNVFVLINSVDENVRFYKNTRCLPP